MRCAYCGECLYDVAWLVEVDQSGEVRRTPVCAGDDTCAAMLARDHMQDGLMAVRVEIDDPVTGRQWRVIG